MRRIQIKQYGIPLYLASILLIVVPLTPQTAFLILFPLSLLCVGIYMNKFWISFPGLCVFYLVTLTLFPFVSFHESIIVYVHVILVLVPSFLLISQILQDHNIENVLAHRKKNRSALYMILLLLTIVLVLFYAIGFTLGSDAFFSFESFQSQLLLFICCSLLVFIPFLLKPIRITKKTMQ